MTQFLLSGLALVEGHATLKVKPPTNAKRLRVRPVCLEWMKELTVGLLNTCSNTLIDYGFTIGMQAFDLLAGHGATTVPKEPFVEAFL